MLKVKCDKDFIHCMCECAKNLLKGNIPLTHAQMRSLSRHKRMLRQLALKRTSLTDKKQIIQRGGFLGLLLGPIVSAIGSLLGFNNNNNNG